MNDEGYKPTQEQAQTAPQEVPKQDAVVEQKLSFREKILGFLKRPEAQQNVTQVEQEIAQNDGAGALGVEASLTQPEAEAKPAEISVGIARNEIQSPRAGVVTLDIGSGLHFELRPRDGDDLTFIEISVRDGEEDNVNDPNFTDEGLVHYPSKTIFGEAEHIPTAKDYEPLVSAIDGLTKLGVDQRRTLDF